jgi:hypothetical protein
LRMYSFAESVFRAGPYLRVSQSYKKEEEKVRQSRAFDSVASTMQRISPNVG